MVGVTHKINSVKIENFQRYLRRERWRNEEGEGDKKRERLGGMERGREEVRERDCSLVDNWKQGGWDCSSHSVETMCSQGPFIQIA